MTTKSFFTDRSRVIGFQDCGRRRFLEYHSSGTGLSPIKKPLPLAVGGAVHSGIEVLLRAHIGRASVVDDLGALEDAAVGAAMIDFSQYTSSGLELDEVEKSQLGAGPNLGLQLAQSLGLPEDHPDVLALLKHAGEGVEKFDAYLVEEQGALVEAMVRAYTRRRLRKLVEQFEILEVEREGTWQLYFSDDGQPGEYEIVFMSRPDALLRDRESNELMILSLKTTASWDVRKARDAEHDMQGLSEGVEVERRLGEWWYRIHHEDWAGVDELIKARGGTDAMIAFLRNLGAAPRIYAIRYEYLLKGDRKINDSLGIELGVQQARTQNSHLVRPYCNPGMTSSDTQWCWSYRFKKDDGGMSNLYYKNWKTAPIWKSMSVKKWIDILDSAVQTYSGEDATSGLQPRLLGYSCEGGQATGYTEKHPLDDVFLEPITVFRHDDDLRDWIDQTIAQEDRIVEGLVKINETKDIGEVRHLLNVYFPMVRTRCEYPSTCSFVKVCYANNEDVKMQPLSSGLFKIRVPNHPVELKPEVWRCRRG